MASEFFGMQREAISARIGSNSFSGFVVCLYRLQNGTFQFFDEFLDLLENIIPLHDNLYILGDFNLHVDNANGQTSKFNEILMLIFQLTFMVID